MQIRKAMAAGSLAVLMAGSSVGFAADLSDFPQPFVDSSGNADFLVVTPTRGDDIRGLLSDTQAAGNIAAALGSRTAKGSASAATVSGQANLLGTSSQEVYLNALLTASGLANEVDKKDFPVLLADGEVVGDDDYGYDQVIEIGNASFKFIANDNREGDEDPEYVIQASSANVGESSFVFKTTIEFDTDLDLFDEELEDSTIELFGNEYAISRESIVDAATTDATSITFFRDSQDVDFTKGETKSVSVGGRNYDISVRAINQATDANRAWISVGNKSKTLSEGETAEVGGIDIRAKNVFYDEDGGSIAVLSVGSDKLVLEHGEKVEVSEDKIDDTLVEITNDDSEISSIVIYANYEEGESDILGVGEEFVHPVFDGIKLRFDSLSESAESGDEISIETDDEVSKITFTPEDGDRTSFNFIAQNSGTTTKLALDEDSDASNIHIEEGADIEEDDYFILSDGGDEYAIIEATDVRFSGGEIELELTNILTGEKLDGDEDGLESENDDDIDGVDLFGNTEYNITGDGSNSFTVVRSDTNDRLIAFPTIETANGAKIAFFDAINITDFSTSGDVWVLPSGEFTLDSDTDGTTDDYSFLVGGVRYDKYNDLLSIAADQSDATDPTSVSNNAGVIIVEEEGEDGSADEVNAVIITGTADSTDGNIDIDNPTLTAGVKSDYVSLDSDNDKAKAVDAWGTLVVKEDNDDFTVYYPDEQVFANVAILGPDGAVSGGAVTSTSGSVSGIGAVKSDSQVTETEKSSRNLILVGGPVVNSLVAELAAAGKTKTADEYRTAGRGYYILDYIEEAFETGAALVVAGNSASDTQAAASIVANPEANSDSLTGNTYESRASTVSDSA